MEITSILEFKYSTNPFCKCSSFNCSAKIGVIPTVNFAFMPSSHNSPPAFLFINAVHESTTLEHIVLTVESVRTANIDSARTSNSDKSCLAVFVDRKTRYYWLVKMKNKSAEEMLKATVKTFKNYPIKSITYDNGTENMNHLIANKILGCESYFCRPYCSADKGSIENRNKILR